MAWLLQMLSPLRVITIHVRLGNGRLLAGRDSHVFLPIITVVLLVYFAKCWKSFIKTGHGNFPAAPMASLAALAAIIESFIVMISLHSTLNTIFLFFLQCYRLEVR